VQDNVTSFYMAQKCMTKTNTFGRPRYQTWNITKNKAIASGTTSILFIAAVGGF